jgi:hypothetical protein
MPAWLSSIKSKLTDMLGKTPAAYVGVFGKHPGWDDHIDDLGLESEALVAAKQDLYVNGIGGVIDSGRWESPQPDEEIIGFHHVFLWCDHANTLMGRLWDSSDGKGRTKYPMIICVHLSGRKTPGLPDPVPFLESLENSCRAATTSSAVHQLAAAGREKAASMLEAPPASSNHLRELAGRLELSSESEAAHRIAYAAESCLSALRNGSGAEIGLQLSRYKLQPQHIRVPADSTQPFASLMFWRKFFQAFLPSSVPQFYLAALERNWIDFIAGPLTTKHLTCLRTGGKSMPLANEIPFNLSASDHETARKCWTTFLGEP